jgi:NAD(P)-dependent dehydrogenase (short-subunit alcohol dehydrogenase family)
VRIEPGQIAVVTGGASGIGFALAAAAAGHGMHVVLVDVRTDALEAAAARLRGAGAAVSAVVADVARPDDIEEVARTAFGLGRVQLVCSNAGIVRHGRAWEVPAAWRGFSQHRSNMAAEVLGGNSAQSRRSGVGQAT